LSGVLLGLLIGGGAVIALLTVLGVVVLVRYGDGGGTAPAPAPVTVTETAPVEPTTPAAPTPRLTEATALVTRFLNELNVNDQKKAAALGCVDSKQLLPGQILLLVEPPTKLAVDGPATGQGRIAVPFSGTTKGNPYAGTAFVQDFPGQPLCVRILSSKR
jgi:hypothetical protein